ncbi:MAG TPA: FAD-dependent monooxygenase [Acidimicrobiales bacterium]|nr:FAD-dependent monooxygenase [Acidimicrobiales bacterium]
MNTAEEGVQVLVVGAGPSGLTMAAELARHGVSCRIVDRSSGPTTLSKATGMQARTLEVLRDMGVVEEILAAGHLSHGVNLYAPGKHLLRFTYDDLDSPYRYMLNIPQSDTEQILGRLVARLGVRVEWDTEVTTVAQDDDGVTATVSLPGGGSETVRASWVVGCDGAHSIVRHTFDIPFAGETYPQWFALADAGLDWSLGDSELHGFIHPDGVFFVIPMPAGRFRLIVESAERTGGEEPTLEDFQAALDQRGPGGATITDPGWMTSFHVNSRRAARHRAGRAFIAGDAAHVHSPAGGQGLNTSIQDSYNLAWKLALVEKGLASPDLLDSYEAERAPVAKAVLRFTNVITKVLTLQSSVEQSIRNHVMPLLGSLHGVQHQMATQDAELDITYRRSPVVAEHHGHGLHAGFGGGPHAGDRAPDAGPLLGADGPRGQLFDVLGGARHTLLLFPDARGATWPALGEVARSMEDRYPGMINVVVIAPPGGVPGDGLPQTTTVLADAEGAVAARYHAGAGGLYLVRPDGYIGYRDQPADAGRLQAYLEALLSGALARRR